MKKNNRDRITIHVERRPRPPHKPTVVHKNRKRYTRKGRQADLRRRQDVLQESGA